MARYINNLSIQTTDEGQRYYGSAIPVNPVTELIEYTYQSRVGDRWDTLAYKYLGNAALWYVIANANNSLNGSIFIKPGTTVIIPQTY